MSELGKLPSLPTTDTVSCSICYGKVSCWIGQSYAYPNTGMIGPARMAKTLKTRKYRARQDSPVRWICVTCHKVYKDAPAAEACFDSHRTGRTCPICGEPMDDRRMGAATCSDLCRVTLARRRRGIKPRVTMHEAATVVDAGGGPLQHVEPARCEWCNGPMDAERSTRKYCCPSCRQSAYRARATN